MKYGKITDADDIESMAISIPCTVIIILANV